MRYWLMKTEPTTFSFDDLVKSPKRTTSWEGVRNYQARNLLRDEIKSGHRVLIYHSNCDEPAVIGIAEVVRDGYADITALDRKHKYFDPDAAKKGATPWIMVDVKATHRLKTAVTRDQMKAEKKLAQMMLLKKGSRLSVQPVTAEEFEVVSRLGKPAPL